ncbi:hypothetical protein GOP47_0010760 [Adiantum capillus-veneris]|uniref:PHD-type domain-containing protein n=1 Tax=Adiantum capillus-veneris TaxID=13818 RepID=A0A9D4ZGP9_ADICA|nr:hypothetical protein GOP47_0010760 [Adiantum capillus-veneris]
MEFSSRQELQGRFVTQDPDAGRCVEDMVKSLMPRFEFKGDAAKFAGQVGKLQPELALLCKCCGKDERKKSLICDVCESSFHLKCLRLRTSNALLLDRWLCATCSAAEGAHALNSTSDKRSALRSSIRKRRDMDTQKIPPQEENEIGKIRFVLKLKTAHFKGARALANEVVEVLSDRSTDESAERCARRPSCQMDCVSDTPQSELATSPVICSQGVGKELIGYDRARSKRTKVDESVMASPRDTGNACIPPSHGDAIISSDDYHQTEPNLYLCGDTSQELNLSGVDEVPNGVVKSVIDLCSGKDAEVISPHPQYINCLSLALVHKQLNSGLGHLETVTEETGSGLRKDEANDGIEDVAFKENEEAARSLQEELTAEGSPQSLFVKEHPKGSEDANCINGMICDNETSATKNITNKVDTPEQGSNHVPRYTMAHAEADVFAKLGGHVLTHERVKMNAQESRSLVKVVDDIQKGPWYKDAIELMGLEPFACKGNHHEAMSSSKQHPQLHVKLNTWCLLQVYADCRERCIIVYDLGKPKRDNAAEAGSQNPIDTERTWSLGGGFYVLLLGSKNAANESVCCRIISFQGGIGYAIPYVPSFSPMQELEDTCPVWVTFVHLPVYFYPFLQELAMPLGKVLYVPRHKARESSDSPRVCVCWKVSNRIPEFLYVDMDGLGSKKLKIEFDLSLLRNLSRVCYQGSASMANG